MSAVMLAMRGKTVARFGAGRSGASRFKYAPSDVQVVITSLYSWKQNRGPKAIEPSDPDVAWTPVVR